jgi:hypothetical protein
MHEEQRQSDQQRQLAEVQRRVIALQLDRQVDPVALAATVAAQSARERLARAPRHGSQPRTRLGAWLAASLDETDEL